MRPSGYLAGCGALVAVVSVAAQPKPFNVDSVNGPTKQLEFTTSQGTWMSVDVSPDGRFIAFDLLGHLYEMPAAGGTARALTTGRSYNHLPRYSPDGSKILFVSDRSGKEELWLFHRGPDSVQKFSKLPHRAVQGTWSRDGRFVYVTASDMGAKMSAHRLDLFGSQTDIVAGATFGTPGHWTEGLDGKAYFSQPAGPLYQSGFQIKRYDLTTGKVEVYIDRPGGAADPVISPDGKTLAYIHRDDRQTVLVLHDLASKAERTAPIQLDRDRMESGAGTTFGIYPNFSWTPDSREIVIAALGGLHAVNATSGARRTIPFQATVRRTLAQTIKFPVAVPVRGTERSRSHRWGQRIDRGIIYEALGDIYLKSGAVATNLTQSGALESSPVADRAGNLYYASWRDDSLGAVWSMSLNPPRRPATRISTAPSQYGSLTLSQDGRTLAYLRGGLELNRGQALEEQDQFDLMVVGPDRIERKVTTVAWKPSDALAARRPPALSFSADGATIYLNELVGDTLYLRSVRSDGMDPRTLYAFPHGTRASLSPDGRWIAFREYLRSFVTPASYSGKLVVVSGHDKQGVTYRVDPEDGDYLEWSPDSKTLAWLRGQNYHEKQLSDVLAQKGGASVKTDLSVEYQVARPTGVVALTNARVITVDRERRVLDRATIVVRDNLIEAVGPNVAVPSGARVFDLAGKTVMPGMIDAHGHYNPDISTLNVIEQHHVGLLANLAYGTTTVYEVYGNHVKDFHVSDLQRAGLTTGSRLLSVGPPIYGLRTFRPKLFRPIESQADADEVVSFNKAFGATALKDYVQFNRSARMQMYDAARRMGVNVVAESAVDFQMDWTMLMDGVSGIEHTVGLTPLYEDVVKLWAATGAGNTPTLIVSYNGPAGETAFHQDERLWEDPKLLRFFPKENLIRFRRPTRYFPDDIYAADMARELRKLYQAGVSLQVSGHGQMHGLDKHWEMELFAKGGFPTAEIIDIATIKSAAYLGLDSQLGSLEPGKLADLIILDANPLDDIRNARKIDRVMLNGVLYRGADASRMYPEPEPAGRQYWFRGSASGSQRIDRDGPGRP